MSNVDLGIEGQPIEGTAPAVAVSEPASQSASRDQPTVVITLEALQSLIQTPVPSHVTLVSEAQVGVQVAIPPTISKELPGTAIVTEAPLRAVLRQVDHRSSLGDRKAICEKCGLMYEGPCTAVNKTCYNCGKSDHLARVS
ncbi:hypothetical protein SDJN03_02852, partial [Cucurbita argyrosperma subsp. sororia]